MPPKQAKAAKSSGPGPSQAPPRSAPGASEQQQDEAEAGETADKLIRKHKKFSKEDDLVLLRQVQADRPFAADRGSIMDAWVGAAEKVKRVDGFGKANLTNKSAQARFNVLLDAHRAFNARSERASGVSEDYSEKHQLLDELLAAVEEHARSESRRIRDAKAKIRAEEDAGKVMRDAAVARMKDRKAEDASPEDSAKRRRLNVGTVIDLIREDSDKEREANERRWEEKRKERASDREMKERQWNEEREEREAERRFRLELARLETERLDKMIKLATMKSSMP